MGKVVELSKAPLTLVVVLFPQTARIAFQRMVKGFFFLKFGVQCAKTEPHR